MLRVVLILALISACCFARPNGDSILDEVLEVAEKGLAFFSEDYSSINVDGLFGLRLAQGQLQEAVRECKRRSCDEKLLHKLERLEKQLNLASDSALPYVKETDPAYYNRFLGTINKPYVMPYVPTVFDKKVTKTGHDSHYDEERGDACYARMLGTYEENNSVLPKCNITRDCWDYMTKGDTSAYFITHQLLFFIITEHVGCTESVENYMHEKKVFEVQKEFCNNIFEESKALENGGKVSSHRKDLFLEQTVLCGPLGFEEFMRPDWMKMVLSWPNKRLGCFQSDFMKLLLEATNESNEIEQANHRHGKEHTDGMKEIDSQNGITMRKLLREKQMKDGCLSHTSGLGFGVICTYLRYLVRYI